MAEQEEISLRRRHDGSGYAETRLFAFSCRKVGGRISAEWKKFGVGLNAEMLNREERDRPSVAEAMEARQA